ncbi:MAG: right-handed parallel beta-helix repeat-containing protein [Polyangiaceae bacterium]|nr:right-handed parallel beta-helix repeat-containing protein [Polyangiaceae bacterium]
MKRHLISFLLISLASAVTTEAAAQQFSISDKCYLPGIYSSNRCSVRYGWSSNTSNAKLCLWDGNNLSTCEGYTNHGGSFDWIDAQGKTLEFRRHAVWPTQDPAWPNAAVVRRKGTLLYSKYVSGVTSAVPLGSCTATLSPGQSVKTAVLAASVNAVICLNPGLYLDSGIELKTGQVLRGTDTQNRPVIRNVSGRASRTIVMSQPGATVRDLIVEGQPRNRSQYGILVYATSGSRIYNVDSNYAIIGIGVNAGTDIDIRESKVSYAGDGRACSGCAQPSIWITDSSNVRVVNVHMLNNGIGPEGDGELSCYNTPDLLVQGSSVTKSGAGGMYIVNCDRAILAGNVISEAQEWGLDIVNTGYTSGSDYGLFLRNNISGSRHGGVVLKNTIHAAFRENTYTNNRVGPNASGRCNGVNKRGTTTGFSQFGDNANRGSVSCND